MTTVTSTPGQPPHSLDECPFPTVLQELEIRGQGVVASNRGADSPLDPASSSELALVSREGGNTSPLVHPMVRGPLESQDSSLNPGESGKTALAAGHRGAVNLHTTTTAMAAVEAVPKVHSGFRMSTTAIVSRKRRREHNKRETTRKRCTTTCRHRGNKRERLRKLQGEIKRGGTRVHTRRETRKCRQQEKRNKIKRKQKGRRIAKQQAVAKLQKRSKRRTRW